MVDDFDMLADSVLMYASGERRSSEELAAEYRAKARSGEKAPGVHGSSTAFAATAAVLAIAAAKRGDGLTSKQSRQ